MNDNGIFAALAAPLDPQSVKTLEKKDKKSGRVTAIRYIDARTVIDRLNSICPGQWTFETELLAMPQGDGGKWVFKGRLTVCGAWQEDVGMNDNEDYYDPPKAAVSDALKRCAVHFGIGAELYGDAPKNAKQGASKPPQGNGNGDQQQNSKWPARPWQPEILKAAIAASCANKSTELVDFDKAKNLAIVWKKITGQDDITRLAVTSYLVGKCGTFKELSSAAADAFMDWLNKNPTLARQEAQSIKEMLAEEAPKKTMLDKLFPRNVEGNEFEDNGVA